ncbi:hypothetical protein AX17_004017 [Amanita inopinata Kibby_2008]|nr:hypothetical protein AX17_004017 [Amanita inopinata Kibby_2008]
MSDPHNANQNDEHNDWDDEEEYDDDDDIDAEAEEIARRLGAELWADIRKAKADGVSRSDSTPLLDSPAAEAQVAHASYPGILPPPSSTNKSLREEEALKTAGSILASIDHDALARSILASTLVVESGEETVLTTLQNMVTSGMIVKDAAMRLSHVLVELARSEALFGFLRHSDAPAMQLDKGKRKRDESDMSQRQVDVRPYKRPYLLESGLQSRIEEAVQLIMQALGGPTARPLEPAIISSICLQLHQVFLFAVTSSAGGGRDMHALQELGGLIQVIGVLSGIQIGQTAATLSAQGSQAYPLNPTYPWLSNQPPSGTTDIGTAVYPCLVAGCRKTFSRLYSLRGHQRLHALHRPFRCNICPASFARNHDLKRHIKLHGNKAWRCGGCSKVFSRRDAIKRHKNSSKLRGPKSEACIDAEVLEVELDEEEGEDSLREERRAKIWSGISMNPVNNATGFGSNGQRDGVEDGEIQAYLISSIQTTVLGLHGLLRAHVGNALGSPLGQNTCTPMDPAGSQATLASVIARAQSQHALHKLPSEAAGLNFTPEQTSSAGSLGPSDLAQTTSGEDSAAGKEQVAPALPTLSMYGLSDEQTRLLEQAIANAASAAQAQAEAEAALEEEEDDYDQDEDYDVEGQPGNTEVTGGLAITESGC